MKTKEELLQEHIETLEKLLDLKTEIITELEKKIGRLETFPNVFPGGTYPSPQLPPLIGPGTINLPSVWTIDPNTCQHEYPNPWFATVPPPCKKCGTVSNPYVVTCDSGTNNL